MADFCKQCAEEILGRDEGDLAHNTEAIRYYCICEGCGFTVVDKSGKCIGACLRKHGDVTVQTPKQFTKGIMP